MKETNRYNKCANEFLDLFVRWTEKLNPEEVLGIIETFKYVYLNRYVEKKVSECEKK